MTVCPSIDQLSLFSRGLSADEEFQEIAQHVELCETCLHTLSSLSWDTPLLNQLSSGVAENLSWIDNSEAQLLTRKLLRRRQNQSHEDHPGRIGRVRIDRHIASGSYGRVYLGVDEVLDRQVAVKLPYNHIWEDHSARERYEQEARLAARLKHPGIVPVYDVGTTEEGQFYILSAFVDGVDLNQWKRNTAPNPREAAKIVAEIASILEYAHAQGLHHRDVKPGNVMVDEQSRPHLVDFGLSIAVQDENFGQSDRVVGTPAYMPPERLGDDDAAVDHRGDLYSLGVVLYELLTNQRPYPLDIRNWRDQIRTIDPKPPREVVPELDPELESICLKALAKDPALRYQTAEEFADDLKAYVDGNLVTAHRYTRAQRIRHLVRQQKYSAVAAIGVGAVLAALAQAAGLGTTLEPPVVPVNSSSSDAAAAVVALRAEETAIPIPVEIVTEPAGALVAIVPIDRATQTELPDRLVRPAGKTPLTTVLPPGEYLVEVAVPGYGFQQVYRQVEEQKPKPAKTIGAAVTDDEEAAAFVSLLPAELADLGADAEAPETTQPAEEFQPMPIAWEPIHIRRFNDMVAGMVKISGGEYEMGSEEAVAQGVFLLAPRRCRVETFYIAPYETTYENYSSTTGVQLTHSQIEDPSAPIGNLNYFEALKYAEVAGRRLPTEEEWEFVATNGGTTTFPWGNDLRRIVDWSNMPGYDRTMSADHEPVFGMFSGCGEWTTSPQLIPNGGPKSGNFQHEHSEQMQNSHIIRGASFYLCDGGQIPPGWWAADDGSNQYHVPLMFGARWREAVSNRRWLPRLGVRLACSANPRFLPPLDELDTEAEPSSE